MIDKETRKIETDLDKIEKLHACNLQYRKKCLFGKEKTFLSNCKRIVFSMNDGF